MPNKSKSPTNRKTKVTRTRMMGRRLGMPREKPDKGEGYLKTFGSRPKREVEG